MAFLLPTGCCYCLLLAERLQPVQRGLSA